MTSLLWLFYEAGLGLALLAAGPFLLARRGRHYLPTLAGRLGLADGGNGGRERDDGDRGTAGCRAGARAAGDGAEAAVGKGGGADGADGNRAAGGDGGGRVGGYGGKGLGGGGAAGPAARDGLWLHAVSVGEVSVAATLARALPPELPLLVTTITPTGQALARRLFAGRARVAYLPFDLRPPVTRFWRRFAPAALVLVEGDYWPLLLREARRRGLPVAVVNGRVGDRSFGRMRRVRPLAARLLFSGIERFAVQSAEDGARLAELGVETARLTVTGNLKFETPEPRANSELAAALDRLAGGRPVVIAGSTMPGEEQGVLEAFAGVGGGRRTLLVLAPRHPERWDEVAGLLEGSGLAVERRTRLAAPAERPPDVLLLDSIGELAALYRQAAAVFIGGTLVDTGGHNPLEAARYGLPIAVGPSMHNFRDMAERFDAAGAWQRVANAAELGRVWQEWLTDPASARQQGERAAALLRENRGALDRTLEMLEPILARLGAGGRSSKAGTERQTPAGGAAGGGNPKPGTATAGFGNGGGPEAGAVAPGASAEIGAAAAVSDRTGSGRGAGTVRRGA
jgi:3-deoxy-D-manno-octulosonic-acid transferase